MSGKQAKKAFLMAATTNDTYGVNENNFEEAKSNGPMTDKREKRPPEDRDKVKKVFQNEYFNYNWLWYARILHA